LLTVFCSTPWRANLASWYKSVLTANYRLIVAEERDGVAIALVVEITDCHRK
jgi:hypothetical protein